MGKSATETFPSEVPTALSEVNSLVSQELNKVRSDLANERLTTEAFKRRYLLQGDEILNLERSKLVLEAQLHQAQEDLKIYQLPKVTE